MNEQAAKPAANATRQPALEGSLAQFGAKLRDRAVRAETIVQALLDRIADENAMLDAFTHVNAQGALAAARAIDACVDAAIDLGPLMGVPIVLKDLYAVDAMPLTAGSRIDLRGCMPAEGSIVRMLKRGGAIVLGKTRTTEFAFGAFNLTHPTPRNPSDASAHRMPGGSSSGSAVAQAAGLCAIAFGSDTGGSVRQPAALCGVAGFKPTAHRLPLDGVFPLSPTFDSPGWFADRVADLSTVWEMLSGESPASVREVDRLVFGRPDAYFFDNLDADVTRAFDAAERALRDAGARVVPVTLPQLRDLAAAFGPYLSAELVSYLGRERVIANLERMDSVACARIASGLTLTAEALLRLRERFAALAREASTAIAGVDVLITPTCPRVAPPVDGFRTTESAAAWNADSLRLTRPGNLFGLCGISLPIGHLAGSLPVGLQLLARGGDDANLLAIAASVEKVVGATPATNK
ncbi:MAG TPA: amidase [Casimicrobiaceae bacterium]|nr:amidase [Casimicrobiaceae bacterium]